MNKIVAIAIRHWKPLLLWNLLILGVTCVIFTLSPRVWTATTQLTVPGSKGNLDASLGVLGSLKNGGADITTSKNSQLKLQKSILTSDTLMTRMLADDPAKVSFKRLSIYKQLFTVNAAEDSPVLSISASATSPELAQERANKLTKLFQQRLNELRQTNRNSRREFSNKELAEAQKNLLAAQQALAQFQQSSGLVNTEEQTKSIVTTIDNLIKAQSEALSLAAYSQNRVATLSNRLKMMPEKAISSLSLGENKQYQFFRNKLSEVDADLARLRSKFNDAHPAIQQLLQQRQGLLNQVQSQINQVAANQNVDTTVSSEGEGRARLIEQLVLAETEASGQKRRAQQIQIQLNQLRNNLNAIPAQQAKLAQLQRHVDVTEGVYKGLVAQVQQTNIDVFDVYPNVEVLDAPRVDSNPVSPKLSLMVLNALLGSVIGSIALVLLLERRNPLLSPQDLQDMKFPIVVSISRLTSAEMNWELTDDQQVKFQRLASSVSLQNLQNRRLLITSAMEGEGKTTVTLGLARALVDLGFRVLVVDGDLMQGELSSKLGYIPQSPTTVAPINIEQQLDLLPAIPCQGKILQLVSRGRFEKALADAEAHGNYDYVLVDTAPVTSTTATALMTAQIPHVLFVVRQGMSYSNSVRDSLEQLTQHQAQILGLVVNGVESTAKPYMQRLPDALTSSPG